MKQANSLIEIIRQQATTDEKIEVLAGLLSTQITATLNSLLTVVSAVDKVPGLDREAVRRDLEELKVLGLTADVDHHLYAQTIDLVASRLSHDEN